MRIILTVEADSGWTLIAFVSGILAVNSDRSIFQTAIDPRLLIWHNRQGLSCLVGTI